MNRETFQVVLALSRTLLLLVIFASVSNSDGFAQGIQTFDVPNAIQTSPTGINEEGQITGCYLDANGQHGFVRDRDGQMVTFDPAGSIYTFPKSINSEGQITGGYQLPDKSTHGFLRERDGTIISFDAFDASVTPRCPSPNDTDPNDLSPGTLAINSAGQITGWYVDSSRIEHGFLRQPDGTITAIDDDPIELTLNNAMASTKKGGGLTGGRSREVLCVSFGSSPLS